MPSFERAGLPVRAALHSSGLYIAIRDIPPEQLQDPFMQQTVARSTAAAESMVHIAPDEIEQDKFAASPAGIIFHAGRCGSTVVSQALKQHGAVTVYAEPLPVNEILSAPEIWPRSVRIGALRWLGAAFAAHAGRRYVLKLSSWNTLFCDLVTEAFPNTPWAFCLRDPAEVGAAIIADPPPWFRSAARPHYIAQVVDPRSESHSSEDFFARLYAAFCRSVARIELSRGKLVRYEMLQEAVTGPLLSHFNLPADEDARRRMALSFTRYAKAPLGRSAAFAPDAAAKQAAASKDLREAIETIARPALDRLLQAFGE